MKKLNIYLSVLLLSQILQGQMEVEIQVPEFLRQGNNSRNIKFSPSGMWGLATKSGGGIDTAYLIEIETGNTTIIKIDSIYNLPGSNDQWIGDSKIAYPFGRDTIRWSIMDVSQITGVSSSNPLPKRSPDFPTVGVVSIQTKFRFQMPNSNKALLAIYTTDGKLVEKKEYDGSFSLIWDAHRIPTGNYQYNIEQDRYTYTGIIQVRR